jgi:hypothetical protein
MFPPIVCCSFLSILSDPLFLIVLTLYPTLRNSKPSLIDIQFGKHFIELRGRMPSTPAPYSDGSGLRPQSGDEVSERVLMMSDQLTQFERLPPLDPPHQQFKEISMT